MTIPDRFTQAFQQALTQPDEAPGYFTQVYAQSMCRVAVPDYGFTQMYMNAMCVMTPNFEWIDNMFKNIIFPYDVSFNSIAATVYNADITNVDSGHSQRNIRYDQPLMEYDVAYGVRTLEQMHALIRAFRNASGPVYGFLYYDHIDHTSTFADRYDARAPEPVTYMDQHIGTGDQLTSTFQLRKKYPVNLESDADGFVWRPIYKPIEGGTVLTSRRPPAAPVTIALDGTPTTFFTVNYDTGIVTLTPPYTLNAGATPLSISDRDGSNGVTVSGPAGTFDEFDIGDRVLMSGWANPANEVPDDLSFNMAINQKAGDGSSIRFSIPVDYGVAETDITDVSIWINPAPTTDVVITAGFEFFVPVRFNVKRLPMALEHYGIGGAGDVKLIEIRPEPVVA